MRRHIWLFAELQGRFFNVATDIFQAVENINRTFLLFDYAIYAVTEKYQEMSRKTT